MPRYRENERYEDGNGNRYEVNYVVYDKPDGSYDEVMQLKKQGQSGEMGHTTYHYDKNGNLKSRNDHGNVNLPRDARRVR